MIINSLLALGLTIVFIALCFGLIYLLLHFIAGLVMIVGFSIIFFGAYSFVKDMRS